MNVGVALAYDPALPRQVRLKDASIETLLQRRTDRVERARAAAAAAELGDWTPPTVVRLRVAGDRWIYGPPRLSLRAYTRRRTAAAP